MRKKLLMAIAVGLICTLCYGCGNTNSTDETPSTEESTSQDEVTPDEADTQESDTTETEDIKENAEMEEESSETEEETETVYLLTKTVTYNEDGNITRTAEHEYNDIGDMVKSTLITDDGTEVTTFKYEYENNILRKQTALNEDGSIQYLHEYNEDGNEIKFFSSDSNFQNEYNYENGVKTTGSMISYNEDGSVSAKWDYVYNEYGDEIKEDNIIYFDDGTEMRSVVENIYEYNSDNLVTKKTSKYEGDDGYGIDFFEYDSNGNTTKESYNSYNADGSISFSSTFEYEYDQFNNETKFVSYDMDGNIDMYSETQYTYDSNNNVIKGVDIDENGEIISYYECEYIEMQLPKIE